MATPADALVRLLEALDRLEIPYEVGGSIASSVHGIPRTSADADFVVDLARDRVEEFAAYHPRMPSWTTAWYVKRIDRRSA